jgi:hypothetical protein
VVHQESVCILLTCNRTITPSTSSDSYSRGGRGCISLMLLLLLLLATDSGLELLLLE